MFPLLAIVNEAINTNSNRRAVTFYDGKRWCDGSYAFLKDGISQVGSLFEQRDLENETRFYVLLHLNITLTYPTIVLGVLNAGYGIICVDIDNKNEINKIIEELSVKYIISNVFVSKSHEASVPFNAVFEQSIRLCGETVSLWIACKENNSFNKIPFLYAIKTSGTTGSAKIVQVHHNAIFPNLKDLSDILQISNADVMMLMTPITFDPSIIELFLSLMNGATLCIVEKYSKQDPDVLLDILFPVSGGLVSIIQTTPSLFRRWNSSVIKQRLFSEKSSLRTLILGGEEFPSTVELKSWDPPENIKIYNIYGITEVSCWASVKQVWPAKDIEIDIGLPLSGTILKLDNENEGELLIGSRTRKCLIDDETVEQIFLSNETIFRATGDIFKEVNRKLYFERRKGDVMKRWGIQFSTSSIENIAKLHNNTIACACTTIQINHHTRIGLFIVEKNTSDLKNLKCFLKKRLSKASWPDKIIALDALPLTQHGKVCSRTLQKMLLQVNKTNTKDAFYELWKHYSSENSTGCNDFISDGGDSLTALQLVAESKLIFENFPDTVLGMILQKKTFQEIWSYLEDYREKGVRRLQEENTTVINSSQEIVHSNYMNVSKVVLRGKISVFDNNTTDGTIFPDHFLIKESWKQNLGKCIDASPLAILLTSGEEICIIGSHSGRVAVLEVDNGKLISECTLPDRIESSACISTNAEFYYIGCYDGCVYSVSTRSGKVAWNFKTEAMVKSTCVVVEENIIFGSYDKNIYCLYKEGFLKWKTLLSAPILGEPVLDANSIYSATFGSVAALNIKTGHRLWEVYHDPVFSSPLFSNTLLIVASVSGNVEWLNSKNGLQEYVYKADDMIFSSLIKCIVNEKEVLVFGCQDGFVYCLEERELKWKVYLDSRIVSTPFVQFYEASSSGFVVCASTKGTIFILSFDTGEKITQHSLQGEVFSSPVFMNGKIIVGCRDDNVYCLDIA